MEPYELKKVGSFKFTKLVDETGQFHPSITVYDAIGRARACDLQLVCFAEGVGRDLALCKIIDFGKWRYHEEKAKKKQQKESRRVIKEVKFTPSISDNDINHKVKQVIEFLKDDCEVIVSMWISGRERLYFSAAEEKMNEIIKKCQPVGFEHDRKKSATSIIVKVLNYEKKG
jgi:translation initiation factor IF-3